MCAEKFDDAMIATYLWLRGWRFFRAEDGGFLVLMRSDGRDWRVRLLVDGSRRDVFTIRVSSSQRYPIGHRARLLEYTDRWNRGMRWPKASLRIGTDGSTVRVVGKDSHRLLGPVAAQVVAGLADASIASAPDLFAGAARAVRVPSAQTLDSWLDTHG